MKKTYVVSRKKIAKALNEMYAEAQERSEELKDGVTNLITLIDYFDHLQEELSSLLIDIDDEVEAAPPPVSRKKPW